MSGKLIDLCLKLLSCASITPSNDGAIEIVESELSQLGFTNSKLVFDDTTNLYSKLEDFGPNLCFAGHTDVVPPGDLSKWQVHPFTPKIINNTLYGRGVVDMKAAICAFIIATGNYLQKGKRGTISFLITGDEEGSGKNGTKKVLEWLQEKDEKIDACIVGEPTSSSHLGDTIKIGRRGSITFKLEVIGKQGHVAYPHLAINPINHLVQILYKLQNHVFDNGNKSFDPSNLEVTTVDVGNNAGNVIPNTAHTQFNIRFNNIHTAEEIEKTVTSVISKVTTNYKLITTTNAHPFITKEGPLSNTMKEAINTVLTTEPKINTTGGTSDARFIKDVCPVIEFGLLNSTAHKINESSTVQDIINLALVYEKFIENYFHQVTKNLQ